MIFPKNSFLYVKKIEYKTLGPDQNADSDPNPGTQKNADPDPRTLKSETFVSYYIVFCILRLQPVVLPVLQEPVEVSRGAPLLLQAPESTPFP